MSKRLRVIYVPGVGDSNPLAQRRIVKLWRIWGVEPELFQVNWAEDARWNTKLEKLIARIDQIHAEGSEIGLVGASAGGSAVINAYAARTTKITSVVTICGKLKNPNDIGPKYANANPALVDSVAGSDEALKRLTDSELKRILCRYALFDGVVTTRQDSMGNGAKNQLSLSVGHSATIAIQLIFGAPSFIRFIKSHVGSI